MQEDTARYINDCFQNLVEEFGFVKQREVNEDQTFFVVFSTKTFAVKVVEYRRELYAWLHRVDHPDEEVDLYTDDEIDLYNLIEYLNQNSSNVPKSNYFVDEVDLEECYRKQIKLITSTISDFFPQLDEFFNREEYNSELENIDRFVVERNPDLFGKS